LHSETAQQIGKRDRTPLALPSRLRFPLGLPVTKPRNDLLLPLTGLGLVSYPAFALPFHQDGQHIDQNDYGNE
jgi:hypothetical protein